MLIYFLTSSFGRPIFHSIFDFDFAFNFLNSLFLVEVAIINFFPFSLKASTNKSNFLYGTTLHT